jgi:probable F420-dependent oxidoreductase
MRYSVSVRAGLDAATFSDRVRHWEQLGIGGIWTADHLGMADPFVPLAAAATVTETMQLGSLVINHDFWHPALLARAAGTLSSLAPGRVVLGIGAGHAQVEYEALGLDYRRPPERIARMIEVVDAVQRLLAGETVSGDIGGFRLDACQLGKAAPAVAPLLLIGGNGDRVLSVAAERADIVGLTGFTSGTGQVHTELSHFSWGGLADRLAYVRGRRRTTPLELNLLVQAVAITDDPVGFLTPWADTTSVALAELLDCPFALVGPVGFVREQLARLAEMGLDDVTVFDNSVPALLEAIP